MTPNAAYPRLRVIHRNADLQRDVKTAGSYNRTASPVVGWLWQYEPATTVHPGAFTKLQILLPARPRRPVPRPGRRVPRRRARLAPRSTSHVNAVDANWERRQFGDRHMGITSSDANATLPPNAALAAGLGRFSHVG